MSMNELLRDENERLKRRNEGLERDNWRLEQQSITRTASSYKELQDKASTMLNTVSQELISVEHLEKLNASSIDALSVQIDGFKPLIEQILAEQPDNQPIVDILNGFATVLDGLSQRIIGNRNAVTSMFQPFIRFLEQASALAVREDTMLIALEQRLRSP